MQIHQLSGKKTGRKRVGRGGKRGTYSGRGGKGQTARAGHRIRPAIRDYLKQIPKRRGRHKHSFVSVQKKPAIVRISVLESAYRTGEHVTPKTLVTKNLISLRGFRFPKVKILGDGKLTKQITVTDCFVSASARKAIEEAKGIVQNK